ncbi:ATP-binding protein [Nocardiopsis sp. YSL2]|uniref:ATP-binding protein n=1 Tax=Nocardiopsis sp. YSL2 TaxID=2939492 RepID=UPI0026F41381|nr:ATP-binding protein [Nocardiopsis sp. YSL2]
MSEPTTLTTRGGDLFARLSRIIAERGEDTTPGAVADGPSPDEPGHPEYHHRQRVLSALGRFDAACPPRYTGATTDHPGVLAWADQVAASPTTAPSLLLWGNTGTGKTHAAYAAIRRIALSGPHRFGFIGSTFPDLFAALRPGAGDGLERERRMRRIMTIPLLLLDDLGTASDSVWTEEITYRIVNHRDTHMLPTVFTSNIPPGGLAQVCDDRIASRLLGMTVRYHFDGPDRRTT